MSTNVERNQLLTPDELCEWLRRPKSWVYDSVQRGDLPAIRVGGILRFDRTEIAAWLDERKVGAPR